ncbi:MAG TPA: response regulator [Bryobacteraceae bacterium]|nr:response regulator [Bryobacteraceae bacterium]
MNRDLSASSRRAVVVSPNSRMVEELERLLLTNLAGVPISYIRSYPSPRDLPGAIGTGAPHLVFLDVYSDREQALQLLIEMARLGPSVQVVALLADNEPDFILRCLRAGALDFLIQPFTPDQIEAALSKLARIQPSGETGGKEPAKVYAVMPAKGACGATTIACNLAFQWKRMGVKRILLADLDPLTGTQSFLLKIKSMYSFLDALQHAHELDADLWNAMVTPVSGVDVLLAPEMMVEGSQDLHDPAPIIEFARHYYDMVVIDTGSVYGDWNLNTARMVNEVFLVTTNELPALQAAQRALSYLDTNRIGRWKIRLLVNRYHRDVGLSREVIGTALHTEVYDILPSDYEAVQKSLLEGKPAPANTAFGKSILQLAERLGGRTEQAKKGSSLGGLLGLFTKTSK